MLNVNFCAKLQLAITFMTKIINIARYQSFVDTLYLKGPATHPGLTFLSVLLV